MIDHAPFTMLLPPGWMRLPVNEATDAVFAELIDGVVERAPADRRAALGAMLRTASRQSLASAREQGAIDLILSFATVDGLPIPASIATFRVVPPASAGSTTAEILVSFATKGASAVEIDGTPAIRRVSEVAAGDDSPPHRGVHHIVHHRYRDEWLLISASIIASDDPDYLEVMDAIEALVDAMVSTIRFVEAAPA